jgi:hypothetical protein
MTGFFENQEKTSGESNRLEKATVGISDMKKRRGSGGWQHQKTLMNPTEKETAGLLVIFTPPASYCLFSGNDINGGSDLFITLASQCG